MHVFLWSGFKQSVVSWIDDNHPQHSQQLQRPVFVPRIITEEVQTLQPFILDNLLDVSAKCFIPPSEFTTRRQITSYVGEPDHLMIRNGDIVAIVEEKGVWTLSNGDIHPTQQKHARLLLTYCLRKRSTSTSHCCSLGRCLQDCCCSSS